MVAPRLRPALYGTIFLVAAALALRPLLRGGTDFAIYLQAAHEMLQGGVDLYRQHPDHPAWTYPHWVLLPLAGLSLVLSETTLRVLYGLSLGFATLLVLRDCAFFGARSGAVHAGHALLFLLLFGRCISDDYTNGQISLWVAALLLRGIVELVRQRDARAGALLGTAAAIKLTPLLFLLALPFMRHRRAAAWMATTGMLLVVVLPLPFLPWHENLQHLADFHASMVAPGLGTAATNATWAAYSHSVFGALDHLLRAHAVGPDGGPPVYLIDLGERFKIVEAAWAALLALVALVGFVRARRATDPSVLQSSVVMLAMALFSPLTRLYHLTGILLPAAIFVVRGPRAGGHRWTAVLWWLTAALLAVAMPLRQKKILGAELWRRVEYSGLLHLALVGLLVWISCAATQPAEPATLAGRSSRA